MAAKKKSVVKSKGATKTAKKTAKKGAKPKATATSKAAAAIGKLRQAITGASIVKEAKALGTTFARVIHNRGDLVADGTEILGAKEDLTELKRRGYPVDEAFLKRIELLLAELSPHVVDADESRAAAKERTAKSEAARTRLLQIRSRLAAIADAAELPADWFKLSIRKTDRINPVVQRVSEVLLLARRQLKLLPDRETVVALLDEGDALVKEHLSLRAERSVLRGGSGASTLLLDQLTRLLWDAMARLSRIGLAAFPDDPSREARYRLDHVYARRDGDPETDDEETPAVPAEG